MGNLLAALALVFSIHTAQAANIDLVETHSANDFVLSFTDAAGFAPIAFVEAKSEFEAQQVVDFGFVEVNTTEYRMLRFENNSEEDITGIEMTITGDTAFGGATNCEDVLAAGATCDIRLDFRPWHTGSFWGDFHVRADNFDADVSLRGWGERRRP